MVKSVFFSLGYSRGTGLRCFLGKFLPPAYTSITRLMSGMRLSPRNYFVAFLKRNEGMLFAHL